MGINFGICSRALETNDLVQGGRITRITGNMLEAILPKAQTGEIYRILYGGREDLLAEVVGFKGQETILAPFGEPRGIGPGAAVLPEGKTDMQDLTESLLGRVLDPLGRPMDDHEAPPGEQRVPLYRSPPNPLTKSPINEPLLTGVSVLDVCTTLGRGQRMGIFAGAGVGKSTTLGMLARFCEADVNVIALIGERGREVREFLDRELGEEGLARSVVVVATSDAEPILRVRAAFLATAIAEFFRDHNKHVMLMMDSLTRFAHALREIGLAAGEPPATKGYPPSVFSNLPKLLERAGNSSSAGTLTAFYTVLVEGDDMNEPIADAVRSILDGHLILSRKIGESGRYPAVDISASLSRLAAELCSPEHAQLAARVREVFGGYEEIKDLLQVGAYRPGADPQIDELVQLYPQLNDFFKQDRQEPRALDATLGGLTALLGPKARS